MTYEKWNAKSLQKKPLNLQGYDVESSLFW